MLEKIEGPKDLAGLSIGELEALAGEIRGEIEKTVMHNGGHLASNLGVVELTIALHLVYDAPEDQILWDVGHQSYVHKLLTGRRERFATLRREGGLCGFPRREESEYDAFGTGHASTAISAALGLARARDAFEQHHHVVAVVGDGALIGGEAYEGLNDAGHTETGLVVVLNDNGMAISRNVGGLVRHLTRLRTAPWYWRFKNSLTRATRGQDGEGNWLYRLLRSVKNGVKYLFIKSQFFDALGFVYIGPVDGHDIGELTRALARAKALNKPVIVHVATQKGKGHPDAEGAPDLFHGVSCARAESSARPCAGTVAEALTALAREDRRVMALTAAMPQATGLADFGEVFPERLIDVGIAEEHAATMAAGLAAGGARPYFAVYSTFFQRCFDQMLHDVALQNLPVVFLIDRAGLVGADGATHQGVYDLALFALAPHMHLFAPRSLRSLREMIEGSLFADGPVAIRYPRELPEGGEDDPPFAPGEWKIEKDGEGSVILALGPTLGEALAAAKEDTCVISVESVLPLDRECLRLLEGRRVLTVEDGSAVGGFGALAERALREEGIIPGALRVLGVPREPVPHGSIAWQKAQCGMDAAGIRTALEKIEAGE